MFTKLKQKNFLIKEKQMKYKNDNHEHNITEMINLKTKLKEKISKIICELLKNPFTDVAYKLPLIERFNFKTRFYESCFLISKHYNISTEEAMEYIHSKEDKNGFISTVVEYICSGEGDIGVTEKIHEDSTKRAYEDIKCDLCELISK